MSRVDAVLVETFPSIALPARRPSKFGADIGAFSGPQHWQMNMAWLNVGQRTSFRPHLGESDLLAAVSARAASIEQPVFGLDAKLSGLSQIRNNVAVLSSNNLSPSTR